MWEGEGGNEESVYGSHSLLQISPPRASSRGSATLASWSLPRACPGGRNDKKGGSVAALMELAANSDPGSK